MRKRRRIRWACLVLLVVVAGASAQAAAQGHKGSASAPNSSKGAVQVQMENVMYHFTRGIAVHIVYLDGQVVPTEQGKIVLFDDKNSFKLVMNYAEIFITTDSLARVMNESVFAASGAPIKDVTVQTKNNALLIKGKLKQKGGVPFETIGTLSLTNDGQIRIHTEKVKAAHLPVKGMMDLLGIKLADLINTKKVRGISTDKDDLILDPEQILPAPHIAGRLTRVYVSGNQIGQIFGTKNLSARVANLPGNYMAYKGNSLGFGKLTMNDTDLLILDMDPRDPFDFYLDKYVDQLAAGYTKTTKQNALRVYMPDFNKLGGKNPQTSSKEH